MKNRCISSLRKQSHNAASWNTSTRTHTHKVGNKMQVCKTHSGFDSFTCTAMPRIRWIACITQTPHWLDQLYNQKMTDQKMTAMVTWPWWNRQVAYNYWYSTKNGQHPRLLLSSCTRLIQAFIRNSQTPSCIVITSQLWQWHYGQ